jgi:hypothetical protein
MNKLLQCTQTSSTACGLDSRIATRHGRLCRFLVIGLSCRALEYSGSVIRWNEVTDVEPASSTIDSDG